MSVEDTDFVEVMRDGVAYKATGAQLQEALVGHIGNNMEVAI